MPGERLSEQEREQAVTLSATGKSAHTIGKMLNRSPHTIRAALRHPDAVVKVVAKKAELADLYEDVALRMVGSITDEDISDLNAYQRMVASGIATDKHRLLRGQSTANLALIYALASMPGDDSE